jgi:hypothetical protein
MKKPIIVTPVFHRDPKDSKPASPPSSRKAFEDLRNMDGKTLRELGLRPWNKAGDDPDYHNGRVLWLLPGEWYNSIPNGFKLIDIMGNEELFKRGETDDDIRFGMLAYGILI